MSVTCVMDLPISLVVALMLLAVISSSLAVVSNCSWAGVGRESFFSSTVNSHNG